MKKLKYLVAMVILVSPLSIQSASAAGTYGLNMYVKTESVDYSQSPDLSEFDKRLAVIEQNQKATTNALKDSAAKTADYTRDIKNDLKNDIRRNESVTEQVERSVKQAQRESDQDLKAVRKDVIDRLDRIRDDMDKMKRDNEAKLEKLNRDVDNKIQKAIDNPLAK